MRRRPRTEKVWIVQSEDTPPNSILGVFGTLDEADQYARSIESRYPDGVLYSSYEVGYRQPPGEPYTAPG